MKTAEQILRPWQRTTSPKTDIADDDWKTLFAMVDKGLTDARHDALTEAAEVGKSEILKEETHDFDEMANQVEQAIIALRDKEKGKS